MISYEYLLNSNKILFIQYSTFYSLDKIRKLENRIKTEKITKLEFKETK